MKYLLLIIGIGIFGALALVFLRSPSNDRDWVADLEILPYAEFEDNFVHIHNIRNNTYRYPLDFDVAHYDKTFDLDNLISVDYMVEPFSGWRGLAHTLVSFGFENDSGKMDYIAISVEIRREEGENFSPFLGLLRQYELTYVVADERDVIKLRTNHRGDDVFLYPMKATKEKKQQLFVSMIERVNTLREEPEFYNTLTSSCTTNIVKHVNEITPKRIPFSHKAILPGYSDELAFEIGLIDTDLPFEKAQKHFQINDLAEEHGDAEDFSIKIREGRKNVLRKNILEEKEYLNLLIDKITDDSLYTSFTSTDCLEFDTGVIDMDKEYYEFHVHEKHGGTCPGDPHTRPRVDSFRIMKEGGDIFFWDFHTDSYMPYDISRLQR